MVEWLLISLVFLVVVCLSFLGIRWFANGRQRLAARLADLPGQESASEFDLILGDMTPALGRQRSGTTAAQVVLQQELRDAGYYRPTALMEFTAVQTVLVFLPLFTAAALALVVPRERMAIVTLVGLAVSVLGFGVPRLYVNYRARMRARQIERGLPVAVDLLTLGLTAGQNILTAFQRVSRELRRSYPVLSDELEIVSRQADLRSLSHALRQLADRVRIAEVQTLAVILAQTERLGADISAALLEFSSSFRATMKQRAEAQANRTTFWMLFPATFFLWLPAVALLAGPILFEFGQRQEQLDKTIREGLVRQKESRERRERSRRPTTGQPMAAPDTPEF